MTEYMPSFFDEVFEEKLIQTILVDHDFGRQIMEVLDAEYFSKIHTKTFAEILKNYYYEYDAFPSNDLIPAILDKEVTSTMALKRCLNFITKIQKNPLNGDVDYVKEKSLEFFRLRNILVTIKDQVLPIIEQGGGKLEEIVTLIEKAVNKGTDADIGYDYINDDEERFNPEIIEAIPTGWDPIDQRTKGHGFGKKRLITFLAPPGAGKSTLAVNVGKSALLQGKTVVHYTLELDWMEIAEKYDASISSIEINNVIGNKNLVLKHLKEKLPDSARLIIKEYPMRGASVQTIKNHLTKLKLKEVVPDIIIVDQGSLLRSSQLNKENRHNISNIWIELKGLAQYAKVPVVTLHQVNRSGYNEELITLDMVAECFDIIGHSDLVITMARNLAQKKAGLGKILLGKNRQGEDGVVLAYGIDGTRAMIDIFEMTDEVEELLNQQKEDAQKEEDQSLAAKIAKFRTEKQKQLELELKQGEKENGSIEKLES